MRQFAVYFRLQLKRMFRAFPAIFLMTVLLSALLGALLWLQYSSSSEDESLQKVRVGAVGDLEDNYLSIGLTALKNFDSSRFSITLVQLADEDEAVRELEAGEISSYIVIPEGFTDSVMSGGNMPITYVTGGSQMGIGVQLVQEFAHTVSTLITENQTGIYSMEDFYVREGRTSDELYEAEIAINFAYMDLVFSREDLYRVETVSGEASLSTVQYYVCAVLIILLLLWGMNGAGLLVREDLSLEKLLESRGLPQTARSAGEFLAYLLLMAANLAGLLAAALAALCLTGISVPEDIFPPDPLPFAAGFLAVLLMTAALQFLLYTVADGLISGVLLSFVGSILLAFLSGCLYPFDYFPEMLRDAAGILPTRMGMEVLGSAMQGQFAPLLTVCLLLWAAAFFVPAVWVRRVRSRRQ